MEPLTCALIGHLVGDYLWQNDWMAREKKKNSLVCGFHAAWWSLAVCLFAGWPIGLWFVLSVAHFIQDRWTLIERYMDLVGQKQFRTGPCAPWSTIVVDNVWHVVSIWAVYKIT